ncbi:hypothetical protein [Leucobacter sp. GX24907]
MRKLFWVITGIGIGFVAAHFVNQTPEGRRFFERVNQGAREFGDAVATGYHGVEAAAGEVLEDVEQALSDLDGK